MQKHRHSISLAIPVADRGAQFRLMALIAGTMILLLASCSGKGTDRNGESAVADSQTAAPEAPAAIADLPLTSEGLEKIRIGMRTDHIPPEQEGVYDAVNAEDGYDSNTYLFLIDGQPVFTAYEFTEGTIDVISAESPRVVVVRPDGSTIRLGDEFSEVLALPGVEAEWENADGEGMWCWQWRGLWFQPDQSRLPEALSRELYSDVAPPAADSFTPEARIGYIGTGLPW